jgi:basic membrane protein A
MSLHSHSKKRAIARGTFVAGIVIVIAVAAIGVYYVATLPSPSPTSKLTIGVVYDTGGKGDKSFNDMAYAGVLNANKTLGVNYIEEGSSTASDYVPNIEYLISKNVSLIVCVGFLMDDAVASEAAAHPNMLFAQVDGDVYNMSNVVAIKFEEHVGSALVGALAVAMSKTGTIGFIGGMDVGIIHKFWHGYVYGVQWANNYLGKNVALLPAQYCGTTPAAWDAPDVASAIAQSQMQKGADIIFAAAGASGIGLFNAVGAADQATSWGWSNSTAPKYFAIGVDADQDYYGTYQYFVQKNTNGPFSPPSFVLTSEIKRVDIGVYTVINSVVAGNYSNIYNNPQTYAPTYWNGPTMFNTRGVLLLGLSSNAVGPTQFLYTSQYLTPTAKTVLQQLTAAILNGTATVPEDYT